MKAFVKKFAVSAVGVASTYLKQLKFATKLLSFNSLDYIKSFR
jgi:hypothetical protein